MSDNSPSGHRPLVFRIAAMGDAVLLVPLLKALRTRYGQPCDVISAGAWTTPVLNASPDVADIRILTSRRQPYWFNRSQRDLVDWLRARPPGPVYVCETDDKTHWLLARGGISSEWMCSMRDMAPRGPEEHQIDHELRLARLTPAALGGVPLADLPAANHTMTPLPESVAECERWLRTRNLAEQPLVLIQPGNKRTMRRGPRRRRSNAKFWPEDRWVHVIRRIRSLMPEAAVLVCGSPHEDGMIRTIVDACGDPAVINLAHDLPIPRLMALQARAHSMVSIDTGPAHLASAVGCPLVVLFPRASDHRYFTRPTTAAVEILTPPATREPEAPPHPLVHLGAEVVVEAWTRLAARLPGPPIKTANM